MINNNDICKMYGIDSTGVIGVHEVRWNLSSFVENFCGCSIGDREVLKGIIQIKGEHFCYTLEIFRASGKDLCTKLMIRDSFFIDGGRLELIRCNDHLLHVVVHEFFKDEGAVRGEIDLGDEVRASAGSDFIIITSISELRKMF